MLFFQTGSTQYYSGREMADGATQPAQISSRPNSAAERHPVPLLKPYQSHSTGQFQIYMFFRLLKICKFGAPSGVSPPPTIILSSYLGLVMSKDGWVYPGLGYPLFNSWTWTWERGWVCPRRYHHLATDT